MKAAAFAPQGHRDRHALEQLDAIGLDHRIDRESAADLAAALRAMTAVHEHWGALEPELYRAAVTGTGIQRHVTSKEIERGAVRLAHGRSVLIARA